MKPLCTIKKEKKRKCDFILSKQSKEVSLCYKLTLADFAHRKIEVSTEHIFIKLLEFSPEAVAVGHHLMVVWLFRTNSN
jgi:hypothetical protein